MCYEETQIYKLKNIKYIDDDTNISYNNIYIM